MTKLLLTIAHYPLVLCVLTQVKDQPCHLHVRRKQQKHHPLLHVHSLIHTKHLLLFFQRYFNLAAKLYMFIYIYICIHKAKSKPTSSTFQYFEYIFPIHHIHLPTFFLINVATCFFLPRRHPLGNLLMSLWPSVWKSMPCRSGP